MRDSWFEDELVPPQRKLTKSDNIDINSSQINHSLFHFSLCFSEPQHHRGLGEQFWIDFFKPVYNKRKIADSCLGIKRPEESRLKMSIAQTGKKQSEETKAKRSAALKGRPRPLAIREKISASHFGIVPNEASRAKMSESAKRRTHK